MEHTKHLWRAVLLLVFGGLAAFTGRHFVVPESFGEAGGKDSFYRYGSLGDYMSKPVIHGGNASCAGCHQDVATAKAEGKHAGLSCESCHAPLTVHARGEEKIGDMPANRSHELCADCHQKLRARPASMPQVDIREHLVTLEVLGPADEIPEGSCLACHDVHSPVGSEEPAAALASEEAAPTAAPSEEPAATGEQP